ncbi:unnamed protein product [Arabidopsis arenosa]|uniref:Protein kinase domain-containing protein n=1 Tax=Arabidopsis arenosa TaxID=38785 RepID=A0A8S1ZZU0_ARAAE|nr:unnamed protein product [Arabidopsis arenosa]
MTRKRNNSEEREEQNKKLRVAQDKLTSDEALHEDSYESITLIKFGDLTLSDKIIFKETDGVSILDGLLNFRPVAVRRACKIDELFEKAEVEMKNHYQCDHHPNILRCFGASYDDRFVYICFQQWICTLRDLIDYGIPQKRGAFTDHQLRGFMANYFVWVAQGEDYKTDNHIDENTNMPGEFSMHSQNTYVEMVTDAFDGRTSSNQNMEEEPNEETKKFFNLLNASHDPIYAGCREGLSQLSLASRYMTLKTDYNLSEKCMDSIAQMMKDYLPKDNKAPDSYYDTKKLMRSLSLPYVKIDVCQKISEGFEKNVADLFEDEIPPTEELTHDKKNEMYLKIVEATNGRVFGLGALLSEFSVKGGVSAIFENHVENEAAFKQKLEELYQENLEIKERLNKLEGLEKMLELLCPRLSSTGVNN